MSTTQAARGKALQSIQWVDTDWDYIGDVARSIGLTRSAFVRNAALNAARAVAGSLSPYSVDGATATPQNTRPNQSRNPIAKQGGGELGGGRSRTRSAPQAISGPISEKLGRGGGGEATNEADPMANRPVGPRS
jgi:hypothetical protein